MHTTFLQGLWFLLIGVLWAGYFVLEGFDFGVGMLVRALGRDDVEKRMIIHTIGPVWDGNEVWLLTAGGATFAAFPVWYASAFSGFYLALFLVLAALIIRGVSFEFWGKVRLAAVAGDLGVGDGDRQRRRRAAVRRRLGELHLRRPDGPRPRRPRHAVRPATPVRARRRADDADAVPHARRELPALRTTGDVRDRARATRATRRADHRRS